jgi:hypothetical protein
MVCCRTSRKCHYEPQRKPSGVRATSGWRQDVHAAPQGSWGYEEESPSVVRLLVVQVSAIVNGSFSQENKRLTYGPCVYVNKESNFLKQHSLH